jgi:carbamoyl-phosphate synthase large subunit
MGYIGLIKAFQENGCKVFGVDYSDDAVGFSFCDDFTTVPHGDSESYTGELLKVCQGNDIQIVIPSSDNEILRVGEDKALFESLGISVSLPSYETLKICNDKKDFYDLLLKWGLPHPIVRAPLDTEFPAILKPRVGKGSEGVRLINKLSEIPDAHSSLEKDYILQDFIEGEEYTVDILADKNSKILSITQRKRTRIESGISVVAEIVEDVGGRDVCVSLNDKLQMCGMYCVQYIKNDSGIFILEVNPRFGGGSVLSLKADPTIILNYLNIAQNKPIEVICDPVKMKMKRYYAEVYE